jgi:hypothetical protein
MSFDLRRGRQALMVTITFILAATILPIAANAQGTPTISTLSPNTWTIGGGDFHLTVTGSGFVAGSQVLWNDVPLTPVSSSTTQLVVLVSSYQIATAATSVDITVSNPAANGGTTVSDEYTFKSATSSAPEGVDLAIGIGSRVGGPGVKNYQVNQVNGGA